MTQNSTDITGTAGHNSVSDLPQDRVTNFNAYATKQKRVRIAGAIALLVLAGACGLATAVKYNKATVDLPAATVPAALTGAPVK